MAAAKPKQLTPSQNLSLARGHLERVVLASPNPPDWSNLMFYGMYAVEAAVLAAAGHVGVAVEKNHWDKARAARLLAERHGLPDVSDFLPSLNAGRKAAAYGDEETPNDLDDPQEVARRIEEFVEAVAALMGEAR